MMNHKPDSRLEQDICFMQAALKQARQALSLDEIPVGAVIVKDGIIITSDHNRTRQNSNPLAHAEKLIIDRLTATGDRFLQDYTLYVTLEPCHMCAGMMVWSRLGRLVYAASDPKAGCVGSNYNILKDAAFNHSPEVTGGVLSEEAGALLKQFFRSKRQKSSSQVDDLL